MTIQEQEERDYQMGAASELQNTFARSQMEFDSGIELVNQLRYMGRWVVVSEQMAYCNVTDAALGACYFILGHYDNAADANVFVNRLEPYSDERIDILCPMSTTDPQPKQWDYVPC